MRGLFRPLSVCLLAVFLAVLVAGVASAQEEGLIVGPGESIQRAVNAAERGDTILVRGVHRESVVIRKDGITLQGERAVLESPDRPPSPCFEPSGFCVLGDVNFRTGEVSDYVEDVSITGFTVRNFEGSGIIALGARDANFTNNRAFRNGEYGIAAFTSTGIRIISNITGNDGLAGIYVGDSPRADATVADNDTYANTLGIFIRDARGGSITGNSVHNNCMGMLFLGDAPGPVGNFEVRGNTVRKNTRSCPGGEGAPPISGVGIALLGASDMEIQGNEITGNVPSGPTAFQGGVVVERGFGGTPPNNNSVEGNTILRNRPDIFWDRSGSGNDLTPNECRTSTPEYLCER